MTQTDHYGAYLNHFYAHRDLKESIFTLKFCAFVEHLVGMLLDELDALGVANNTIVAVHSDHGWQASFVADRHWTLTV